MRELRTPIFTILWNRAWHLLEHMFEPNYLVDCSAGRGVAKPSGSNIPLETHYQTARKIYTIDPLTNCEKSQYNMTS